MTPVGWLISAALVVIAGIAYAAMLLNVPLPAIGVGVAAALVALFVLVTRRERALRVPTLREPAPADQSSGSATTAEPALGEPEPGGRPTGIAPPAEPARCDPRPGGPPPGEHPR